MRRVQVIRRFAHLFSAGKSPKIIMSRHGDTYHREVFSYDHFGRKKQGVHPAHPRHHLPDEGRPARRAGPHLLRPPGQRRGPLLPDPIRRPGLFPQPQRGRAGPHLLPGHHSPGVFHLRGGGLPPPLPGTGTGGRQPPLRPAVHRPPAGKGQIQPPRPACLLRRGGVGDPGRHPVRRRRPGGGGTPLRRAGGAGPHHPGGPDHQPGQPEAAAASGGVPLPGLPRRGPGS